MLSICTSKGNDKVGRFFTTADSVAGELQKIILASQTADLSVVLIPYITFDLQLYLTPLFNWDILEQ